MSHCCHPKKKIDKFLWGAIIVVLLSFAFQIFTVFNQPQIQTFTHSVVEIFGQMWFGLLIGIVFVGIIAQIPREFVISILGTNKGFKGIVRATLAGVLLDLCSHGILLVGVKLYERGARLGQIMAFLIASPWNSISLTIILWSMIGFGWMLTFLLLSVVVAIISGLIFDCLENNGVLPSNPNTSELPAGFQFWPQAKSQIKDVEWSLELVKKMFLDSLSGSKIVVKWLFIGVILAALLRTAIEADQYQVLFGATAAGLALTMLVTTLMEVCSEGSVPLGADILTKAQAPGNSFAFLMGGVSTDYTEVMVLKESTKSWKIALFLPLVTLPQIILLAILLNSFS